MSSGSDFRLRRSVLTACENALRETSVDVETFVAQYPEDEILEVPVEEIPETVVEDWYERPELFQNHFSRALAGFTDDDEKAGAVTNAEVRLAGFLDDRVLDVGQYRPDDVADRLIHIRGQVTDRSKRKLRDEIIAFECQRCGQIVNIDQSGDEIQEPHECPNCERQGPFHVDDKQTVMRDFQTIRLQTLPEEADEAETETIELKVFDDLVGYVNPGDRVVANTIIHAKREGKKSRVRTLEGHVKSIHKLTADHTDIDTEPYEAEIRQIANGEHPDYPDVDTPYPLIIQSVAPFHEGDWDVKEAISYQLFGGIEKTLPDGGWMRGNSHILLMGDPGAGKTAIIRYVASLVPRSEYATGKKSTDAGLTAGAVKDEFGDEGWTLQAGTLVRANNGLAVIDELDKMDRDDRDGIIEAMSEQQISVNMIVKGILPAKTSILAAANPKYSTFDPMTDIGQQLDLDEVLLSRFDLWFLLRDEPDKDLDSDIATSMTKTARAGQRAAAGTYDEDTDSETAPPIPPEMFRAYVALAKQCYPVFTDNAMDRIVSEYVELRQLNAENEDAPVPTTARIVEAIHRISEASARMRLAENVLEADVERAIDILYASLETLGVDPETGELDAARMETGTASSAHDKEKALLGIIRGQMTEDSDADYEAVKEEAMVVMDEGDFEKTLEKLRHRRGDVIEPETGKLRAV